MYRWFSSKKRIQRVLVYGSWQVWWECLEGKRCDKGNPNSIHSSNSTADSLPLHGRIRRVEKLSYGLNHGPDFLRAQWTDMIEYYTDRRLTFSSESFPHLLGQVSWMEKLPMDSQAEGTRQEIPVAPASLIECSITLMNEAVPFGQVTDWSLTIEGVAQWIDWDGQEQVEAKDLQPNSRSIRDSSIGSPLFAEGIVALAYPDYSELHVPREADVGHSSTPRPGGIEHIFYMGGEEAESNECTLRILIMVIATRKADIGSDIWACTFDTADINHPPEYVTLSYCWGDVNHLIPIRCDYGTVMVTQSASEMLKKLCYGPMPFWINSLCINQQDLMERNEQVTLMADIYSKASLVLVCLGPDLYKDTELLFNAFKHLVEEIRRVPAVGGTIQY
ncbi:MAG: hypothetical protein LQ350_001161 [Teloschistes chrysophthalmus]|nr:MAG: hypothetical protein LQ350_001161 [Niorma chrysophthalma]